MKDEYDIIIAGGGHAGCEAALAASRMGCRILVFNRTLDTIALMSCNPAIGGVAKGHLVKEIDAMGGEMGRAADIACLHFKKLNSSKGPAVWASRAQTDREVYRQAIKRALEDNKGVHIRQGMVGEIIVDGGRILGVKDEKGNEIKSRAVVVSTGTFLNGLIHIGDYRVDAGRAGEPASIKLAEVFHSLGFQMGRLKTGTPPRLEKKSIDFNGLRRQDGDRDPQPFSCRTKSFRPPQVPCYMTHTTEKTHRLVRDNIGLSPLYAGIIKGIGARYCPSLEDKVMRFPEKGSHPVTLEFEGLDSPEVYAKGLGNSMPLEIQEKLVRSVTGLEEAKIIRPAYAIEYDYVQPTELYPILETKRIRGLFLAGQINGTSGYEEAAAQGLWAGINAACLVQGRPPFLLDRSEAYMAVMVDDLVTKGTDEPYRMFTSRAEYRLLLREDNADLRLTSKAFELGLVTEERRRRVEEKISQLERGLKRLRGLKIFPGAMINRNLESRGTASIKVKTRAFDLLKRPEVNLATLLEKEDDLASFGDAEIREQIEIQVKYEGYVARQEKAVERFRKIEGEKIPEGIEYDIIPGLSAEVRQKLKKIKPSSLGQASRISGMTPAALSILMVYLKAHKHRGKGRLGHCGDRGHADPVPGLDF